MSAPKLKWHQRREFWFAFAALFPLTLSGWSSANGAFFPLSMLSPWVAYPLAGLVGLCIVYAPIAEDRGDDLTRNIAAWASIIFGTVGIAVFLYQADQQALENQKFAERMEGRIDRLETAADQALEGVPAFQAALTKAQAAQTSAEARLTAAQADVSALTPPPALKLPPAPEIPEPPTALMGLEQELARLEAQRKCELEGPTDENATCEGEKGRSVAITRQAAARLGAATYAGEGEASERLGEEIQEIRSAAAQWRREYDTQVLALRTAHKEAESAARTAHRQAEQTFERQQRQARQAVEDARADARRKAEAVNAASENLLRAQEAASQADQQVVAQAPKVTTLAAFNAVVKWMTGLHESERELARAEQTLQTMRRAMADGAVNSHVFAWAQERRDGAEMAVTGWKIFTYLVIAFGFQYLIDTLALGVSLAALFGYGDRMPYIPRQKRRRRRRAQGEFLGFWGEINRWRDWLDKGDSALIEAKMAKRNKLIRTLKADNEGLQGDLASKRRKLKRLQGSTVGSAALDRLKAEHGQIIARKDAEHAHALSSREHAWAQERDGYLTQIVELEARVGAKDAMALASDGDFSGLKQRLNDMRSRDNAAYEDAKRELQAKSEGPNGFFAQIIASGDGPEGHRETRRHCRGRTWRSHLQESAPDQVAPSERLRS